MSGIRGERYIDKDGNEVLTGGLKAAATNKQRNGEDFYSRIGAMGGKMSTGGGFASMPKWKVRECGRKGGSISRRGPKKVNQD